MIEVVADAKSPYRPEIDGLRALAVSAVIVNHFNKGLLPSGYLGVDIFFVISGFVITSSLAGRPSKNLGDFLLGFYARRIKRLVPALILFVIIASIFVCLFNPEPGDLLGLGKGALFGFSNIFLYKASTDYFAISTEQNVFAHTWSLGVEEQFYLLFPLIVWITGFSRLTANGVRNLCWIIGSLSVASLAIFVHLYQVNQPAAYFLVPSRFWELGAGCLLFIGLRHSNGWLRGLESIPPLLVTAGVVSVLFIPLQFAVPATIAVVFLTGVLIACLRSGTAGYDFFTRERVVYIGLISYSLYLWHWGVLSLSRLTIGIHWWSVPFQITLMLLLSIASYQYVEKPLRRSDWSVLRWQSIAYGAGASATASLLIFGIGVKPIHSHLFLGSVTKKLTLDSCPSKSSKQNWVVGDSHAGEFSKVVYIATSRDCQNKIATAETGNSFLFEHRVIGTRRSDNLPIRSVKLLDPKPFIKMVKTDKPSVVIVNPYLVGFFSPQSMALKSYDWVVTKHINVDGREVAWDKALDSYIQNLRSFADQTVGHTKIVIVLPEPEFVWVNNGGASDADCTPQWFNLGRGTPAFQNICSAYLNTASVSLLEAKNRRKEIVSRLVQLQSSTSNVYLYDPLPVLCNEQTCSTHTSEGVRIFRDDDHINDVAVQLLAPDFRSFLLRHNLLSQPTK